MLVVRGRKRVDLEQDLTITNAKNAYLQSDSQFEDLKQLLNTVKKLVQKYFIKLFVFQLIDYFSLNFLKNKYHYRLFRI